MWLRRLSYAPFILACLAPALHAQGTCFRGPIRPACSGFVLLEATGVAPVGDKEHVEIFSRPSGSGQPSTSTVRFQDLPGYFSGALGYVRVINSNTAIGGVGELGFSNTSNMGEARRVAVTGRWRRQLSNWTLDVGAGPLGVQVFNGTPLTCCVEDAMAYGGTVETALMYKGDGGLTAGADVVHGAGRTSSAAHIGVRLGSYGTVIMGALTAITATVLVVSLAGNLR
jgi:hypothetical protein